jgi:hypothetical protein
MEPVTIPWLQQYFAPAQTPTTIATLTALRIVARILHPIPALNRLDE